MNHPGQTDIEVQPCVNGAFTNNHASSSSVVDLPMTNMMPSHSSNLVVKHPEICASWKAYKCKFCNEVFAQYHQLRVHLRTHWSEKPFKCIACQKSFARSRHLTKHMRTHSEEMPFSCDVCNKTFACSSNLTRHCSIHSGEKPFKCSTCQKSFAQSRTLSVHMKTHTGSKPYKLSIHDKLYSASTNVSIDSPIHQEDTNRSRKPSTCEIDDHKNEMIHDKNDIHVNQENPKSNRYLDQPLTHQMTSSSTTRIPDRYLNQCFAFTVKLEGDNE